MIPRLHKQPHSQYVADALAIWHAGVDAVKPDRLFRDKIQRHGRLLVIDDLIEIDLAKHGRVFVVGAGKAAAGMASAFYRHHLHGLTQPILGWINAPEGTFPSSQTIPNIHLHAGRPAGRNEPTEQAVFGTQRILELVRSARPEDIVFVLLSGGGSALLVAPPAGISLADKQAVAQLISAAGGNIEQLNCVRRALSEVKGGGLARNCSATIVTLILSDVLSDALETIGSGPTVDCNNSPAAALQVLHDLQLLGHPRLQNAVAYLQQTRSAPNRNTPYRGRPDRVQHVILANNATAVDAAGVQAVALGYRYIMQSARQSEGDVLNLAKRIATTCRQLIDQPQVDCLISGGEPTVTLPEPGQRGLGGRNQQLALAVMQEMLQQGSAKLASPIPDEFVFLSAGTDGEDGPTDAAGAWFDKFIASDARLAEVQDHLTRCDAYHYFQRTSSLIQCGPTDTNVCDLRIALKMHS